MKVLSSLFTVLVCLICVPSFLQAEQEKPQPQPQLVSSVQADFLQEKQLPILAKPLFSRGRFFFQEPQSLRWEYFTPLHTVLLMRQGQVRKFVAEDGSFREEQGMGVDAMQIVLQEISSWLDGVITDTATFSVTKSSDDLIVLTPKDAAFAKFIRRIELQPADRAGLMKAVTLYEGEGAFTRMSFENSILNEKIPEATFVTP